MTASSEAWCYKNGAAIDIWGLAYINASRRQFGIDSLTATFLQDSIENTCNFIVKQCAWPHQNEQNDLVGSGINKCV